MKKPIALIILAILLFVSVVWLVYFFLSSYSNVYVTTPVPTQSPHAKETPTPTSTPDPLAPKNILILGYTGVGYDGGALTDTMIVAHIRPRENRAYLISVPRDIWVALSIEESREKHFKANTAYAIGIDDVRYKRKPLEYTGEAGGGNLSKHAISKITGLAIDNFISIDISGFTNVVNILGGVDINVPYTFDDKFFPIKGKEDDLCEKGDEEIEKLEATLSGQLLEKEFTCRFEEIHFDSGTQTMDADQALKFVRSRHAEIGGGDFGRSIRQQAFLMGLKDKIFSLGTLIKVFPIVNELAKNVRTDIDLVTFYDLIRKNRQILETNTETINLNQENVLDYDRSSDGQYILVPKSGIDNYTSIHEYIKQQIND